MHRHHDFEHGAELLVQTEGLLGDVPALLGRPAEAPLSRARSATCTRSLSRSLNSHVRRDNPSTRCFSAPSGVIALMSHGLGGGPMTSGSIRDAVSLDGDTVRPIGMNAAAS